MHVGQTGLSTHDPERVPLPTAPTGHRTTRLCPACARQSNMVRAKATAMVSRLVCGSNALNKATGSKTESDDWERLWRHIIVGVCQPLPWVVRPPHKGPGPTARAVAYPKGASLSPR